MRDQRGPRTRWLDLHNLLGITTLAWALVVGATGAMNEFSTPLFALWKQTHIQPVLAASQAQPPLGEGDLASPQAVLDAVSRAFPEKLVTSIRYLWLVRRRRPPEAARRDAVVAPLRVEAAE